MLQLYFQRQTQEKKIVIPYICSTHFLKIFLKNSKKIKIDDEVKKMFIFMFTLILNSLTIEQIENYLMNIYNIFKSYYWDETVAYSIKILSKEIKERNIETIEQRTPDERNRDNEFDYFLDNTDGNDESLNETNHFLNYFNAMLKKFEEINVNKMKMNKKFLKNRFYCPELFQLIAKKLHLIPLWSGIM